MKVTYIPRAAGAEKAEEPTYTGELWKLERAQSPFSSVLYDVTIRLEDGAKVFLEQVPLDTLRFSGGCVVFGE